MKVSLWVSPVVSAVLLFGAVGVAAGTGNWVTGGREQVTATTTLTVDDLKGWMSLQQAADGLGVTVPVLIGLIDAPQGAHLSGATLFKDVEAQVPGFTLSTFRETLRAHLAGGAASPATAGGSASGR